MPAEEVIVEVGRRESDRWKPPLRLLDRPSTPITLSDEQGASSFPARLCSSSRPQPVNRPTEPSMSIFARPPPRSSAAPVHGGGAAAVAAEVTLPDGTPSRYPHRLNLYVSVRSVASRRVPRSSVRLSVDRRARLTDLPPTFLPFYPTRPCRPAVCCLLLLRLPSVDSLSLSLTARLPLNARNQPNLCKPPDPSHAKKRKRHRTRSYHQPPTEDVTLEQFEAFAIARLRSELAAASPFSSALPPMPCRPVVNQRAGGLVLSCPVRRRSTADDRARLSSLAVSSAVLPVTILHSHCRWAARAIVLACEARRRPSWIPSDRAVALVSSSSSSSSARSLCC